MCSDADHDDEWGTKVVEDSISVFPDKVYMVGRRVVFSMDNICNKVEKNKNGLSSSPFVDF